MIKFLVQNIKITIVIQNSCFQDFYAKDSISWHAPGKRDFITIQENGSRIRYQKRHLLHNIGEVHELFVQEHPGIDKCFSLKRIC
jgi:hypothetical protein